MDNDDLMQVLPQTTDLHGGSGRPTPENYLKFILQVGEKLYDYNGQPGVLLYWKPST